MSNEATAVESAIADAPARLERVNISDIRENKTALRDCDRKSKEYQELLASVRKEGVLQTITVRECVDQVTNAKYFGLIDGLQRLNAARDAGLHELDVKVVVANDFQVLQKQVILNVQRIDTKPAEYSQQLKRMLNMNQSLTVTELANMIGKSPEFIHARLNLLKLHKNIATLVDDGKIQLANAYSLAKLTPDEQTNFVDRAMSLTPQEFLPLVSARVTELNKAAREGRDSAPEVFTPQPRQRKLAELKAEYDNPTIVSSLTKGLTSAEEGFKAAIEWSLHMDKESQTKALEKEEARKRELADAKAKRDKEKEEKAKQQIVSQALGVKEE